MKNPMFLVPVFAGAMAATAIPFGVRAQETPTQQTPPAATQETQSAAPQSAVPQSAVPKPGDTIYDNAGDIIGPIDSVSGAQLVVVSAKGKATIPVAAVTAGTKGLMINMTRVQFETAVAAAHAGKTGT